MGNEDLLIENNVLKRYVGEGGAVVVPEGVTEIAVFSFRDRRDVTSLRIPRSVTRIHDMAFYKCTGLTSIEVEAGNPVYHSAGNCLIHTESKLLLLGCRTSMIPADGSVTRIYDNAFFECAALAHIDIPACVTRIGESAFQHCSGLSTLILPEGLERLEEAAFSDCSGLRRVTLPRSATWFGWGIFDFCELEIIYGGTLDEFQSIERDRLTGYDGVITHVQCTDGELFPEDDLPDD